MEMETIQGKLDNVKIKMNENIQFALKNTDKIEMIRFVMKIQTVF